MITPMKSNSGYGVTKDGRIYSNYLDGYLSAKKDKDGYVTCRVGKKFCFVHRLVAETYIGAIPDGYVVHHKDGNRANNNANNLHICTRSDNLKLRNKSNWLGEKNGNAKLDKAAVLVIRSSMKTAKELASQFDISAVHVRAIKRQVYWKNI